MNVEANLKAKAALEELHRAAIRYGHVGQMSVSDKNRTMFARAQRLLGNAALQYTVAVARATGQKSLSVSCPSCGAAEGEPCRARWSDGREISTHASRGLTLEVSATR